MSTPGQPSADCSAVSLQIFHYQADELPPAERRAVRTHLDMCPACSRRLAVEDELLCALRTRLRRRDPAPELRPRVLAALWESSPVRRSRGLWRAWLGAAALCATLGVAISGMAGALPEEGRVGRTACQQVREVAVVVDLICDRAGKPMRQQRSCREQLHVNGLRLSEGQYWSLLVDASNAREVALDPEMRGHRLRVGGELLREFNSLRLTQFEDLGLEEDADGLAVEARRIDAVHGR